MLQPAALPAADACRAYIALPVPPFSVDDSTGPLKTVEFCLYVQLPTCPLCGGQDDQVATEIDMTKFVKGAASSWIWKRDYGRGLLLCQCHGRLGA
jgi:hypothetical protein